MLLCMHYCIFELYWYHVLRMRTESLVGVYQYAHWY